LDARPIPAPSASSILTHSIMSVPIRPPSVQMFQNHEEVCCCYPFIISLLFIVIIFACRTHL
jgi:hypothetical protein